MIEDYKLAKWLDNSLSESELAELKASSDLEVLEKIKHYSNQISIKDFDQETMLTQILNTPKNKAKVIPIYKNWVFRVASILLLFLGIGYFLNSNFNVVQLAKKGEKNYFTLPDESQVVLNADSEIQFSKWNWNNNRKLNLTGEAYFKVAKGKKFEVNTTLGKVTVLGTQFNVKSRNERFEVICFEGKVKIETNNKSFIITKGKNIAFENNIKLNITIPNSNDPIWLNNESYFERESLKNILFEIERQYDIKIDIVNFNSSQLFTGKIPNNNLNNALQIIATSYHLKPIKMANKKIILKPLDAK